MCLYACVSILPQASKNIQRARLLCKQSTHFCPISLRPARAKKFCLIRNSSLCFDKRARVFSCLFFTLFSHGSWFRVIVVFQGVSVKFWRSCKGWRNIHFYPVFRSSNLLPQQSYIFPWSGWRWHMILWLCPLSRRAKHWGTLSRHMAYNNFCSVSHKGAESARTWNARRSIFTRSMILALFVLQIAFRCRRRRCC